jgi:hypothetical protein
MNSNGTLKYGDKHFFADLRGARKGGKMDRTLEGGCEEVGSCNETSLSFVIDWVNRTMQQDADRVLTPSSTQYSCIIVN